MRMNPSTPPRTSPALTRHQRSVQHGLTRIFLTLLLALAAATGSQFSPVSAAAAGTPHAAALQPSQRELTTIEPKAAAATSHQRWDGPLKFYLRVGSTKQHPHPTNRFLLIEPIAPFNVGSMTDTRFADQWNWSTLEVGTDSGRYLLRNNGKCLQISSNGTLGGAACNSGNSREQWKDQLLRVPQRSDPPVPTRRRRRDRALHPRNRLHLQPGRCSLPSTPGGSRLNLSEPHTSPGRGP